MGQPMTFEVHSEARGPHWVAWVSVPGQKTPYRSILLVGASQAEAEARAREWGSKQEIQAERSSPSS